MTLRSARFSGVPELEAILVDRSARLRRGSRGRGVVLVQQALLDLGESLPRFGADGIYGSETEQAVRSYQTKRKAIDPSVLVDGVVGKQTIGLLDADIDALDSRTNGGEDVVHERRDVWVLSDENPWHPTIEWYARAVAAMQARDGTDFADPTCWRHLAEAHGSSIPRSRWPASALWSECQHFTWFFLPWHRIYLHHFEKIVRATIVSLGGSADWALPYWNYSDPTRPQSRSLPPAFRDRTIGGVSGGDPNPLFVAERRPSINAGGSLEPGRVNTSDAFAENLFTEVGGTDVIAGFGGPDAGRNHNIGGPLGSLENVPHGSVHVGVGGRNPDGFMSTFETAARDPIFWLHHANIDRLWEVWLRSPGTGGNPNEERWLDEPFRLGRAPVTTPLRVRDVLDPTAAPLRYRYSDMPVAAPQPVGGGVRRLEAAPEQPREAREVLMAPAEMVGATDSPVSLTNAATVADINVSGPTGPGRRALGSQAEAEQPARVFLKLENVKGSRLPADFYRVLVNAPENADPADLEDRRAGYLSTFGIPEASRSDDEHPGSGLTYSYEITDVVRRLEAAGEWDREHVRVTFTPEGESGGEPAEGDLEVGRISVYYA